MNFAVKKIWIILIVLGFLITMSCFAPLDYNGRDNVDGTINVSLSAIPFPVSGVSGNRAPAFPEDPTYNAEDFDYTVTFTNTKNNKVVAAAVSKSSASITAAAAITPGTWRIRIEVYFSATAQAPAVPGELYALASETMNIQKSETITIVMQRPVEVNFESNGSIVASKIVPDGGLVERPQNPTLSGYTFTGWYKEAALTNPWIFDSDTVVHPKTPGKYTVTLYAKWIDAGLFVEVTDITGVPAIAQVGTPLTLNGIVEPGNATNQTISWSVQNAGGAGATITSGNILNVTAMGTVTVRATVPNGINNGDYTKDFSITAITAGPGTGTVSDPFKVYDEPTLRKVGTETVPGGWTLDAHYIQLANITLSAAPGIGQSNWTPIGDSSTPFKGSYNGGDFTITGLTLTMPTDTGNLVECQGLFGYVKGDGDSANSRIGLIEKVNLVNATITGSDTSGSTDYDAVGGVVGYLYYGTIENCHVSNSAIGGDSYGQNIGGVVGAANSSTIGYCKITATSVKGYGTVGGVIGQAVDSSFIEYCSAAGNVSGDSDVGGLAGYISNSKVEHCDSAAIVSGYDSVGGLIGFNNVSEIENCYAKDVNVTGNDSVGGLVGWSYEGTTRYSYAKDVNVIGNDSVGGLVGTCDGDTSTNLAVENCYAQGYVEGVSDVGGLVGYTHQVIQNCYATGEVKGVGDGEYSGGVVGANYSTVQYCYSTSKVSGYNNVGGVVGYNHYGAWLQDCVALNTEISAAQSVYRVGYNDDGESNTNYGLYPINMTSFGGQYDPGEPVVDVYQDGENITTVNQNFFTTASNWTGGDWNFSSVWQWDSGKNLPTLRSMP